jgi:hypothetical protein
VLACFSCRYPARQFTHLMSSEQNMYAEMPLSLYFILL